MKFAKNNLSGLSQKAVSVVNGEDAWPSVRCRPAGLMSRVREIDCMLADIHTHIQRLHRERTHLGLVREELAGMEAKR